MSNNREQIIHQTKFLGIEFYKRTRIEEHEVQVTARQNITEYPGLLAISERLPLSAPNPSWAMMAHRSIELTILNLIINDFVELVIFTDTKHYLDDLFKQEYKNYRLAIKNEYSGEDVLSRSIFNSIKFVEKDRHKKANIKGVIRHLLDIYLDEFVVYEHPQKVFIIELLLRYSQKYSWLALKSGEKVLSKSQIELDIISPKKEELKTAHQILFDILVAIKSQSHVFALHTKEFYKIIHAEFKRREPSDD